jgi:hypothetical protein
MTQIRLALILPPIQLVLAEVAWQIGRHPHSPFRGDIYWHSTFELAYYGLNTPADRLSFILNGLLSSRIGTVSGELMYLALAATLGYLVGRKIDSYLFHETHTREEISTGSIALNLLTAFYGLYLLLFLCLHNVIFTSPRNGNGGGSNTIGALIRQSLWLIWSLVLIFVPSTTLVSVLRRRPINTSPEPGIRS